jgi:hypothetical protein
VLSVVGLFSYPFVFVRWPITRDVPWANFLIFALAAVLGVSAIRRGFAPPRRWVARIGALLAAGITLAALAMFINGVIIVPRRLPASAGAPRVGARAPDFTLSDTHQQPVALASLLAGPRPSTVRGVLLIFYRGFW